MIRDIYLLQELAAAELGGLNVFYESPQVTGRPLNNGTLTEEECETRIKTEKSVGYSTEGVPDNL